MPRESFAQIEQNASDIAMLKGQNKRFATNEELPENLTQSEVEAIFDAVSGGKTPVDGDTLISFNALTLNYAWSYFESESRWRFRGVDSVIQATNSSLGIVQGDNVAGKIFVENNGTMSLVGYDAIINALTAMQGDYVKKKNVSSVIYGNDANGAQKEYTLNNEIPI